MADVVVGVPVIRDQRARNDLTEQGVRRAELVLAAIGDMIESVRPRVVEVPAEALCELLADGDLEAVVIGGRPTDELSHGSIVRVRRFGGKKSSVGSRWVIGIAPWVLIKQVVTAVTNVVCNQCRGWAELTLHLEVPLENPGRMNCTLNTIEIRHTERGAEGLEFGRNLGERLINAERICGSLENGLAAVRAGVERKHAGGRLHVDSGSRGRIREEVIRQRRRGIVIKEAEAAADYRLRVFGGRPAKRNARQNVESIRTLIRLMATIVDIGAVCD